jgi:hypothetical protein
LVFTERQRWKARGPIAWKCWLHLWIG